MQIFTATITLKSWKATASQREIQLAVTRKPVAFPASSEMEAPARLGGISAMRRVVRLRRLKTGLRGGALGLLGWWWWNS